METKDLYLAYLLDELDAEARNDFEKQLASSQEMQSELAQYREVLALESSLAQLSEELSPAFTVKVMEAIENDSLQSRFFKRYSMMSKRFLLPVVSCAVVVLAVFVAEDMFESGDPSSRLYHSHSYELEENKGAKREVSGGSGPVGSYSEPSFDDNLVSDIRQTQKQLKRGQADSDSGTPPKAQTSGKEEKAGSYQGYLQDELRRPPQANVKQQSRAKRPASAAAVSSLAEAGGGRGIKRKSRREAFDSYSLPAPTANEADRAGAPMDFERSEEVSDSRGRGVDTLVAIPEEKPYGGFGGIVAPRRSHSGEGYGVYAENERVQVRTQPRSTFSLDVDTGSYTNARRFLQMGQLPPSESVRIEEFINYFDYSYPENYELPFSVHYEVAPSPLSKGRHLIKLGVKARDIAADRELPWNLVFLVDVSGSMNQTNKLPLVKSSLKYLVTQMQAEDRIAIVTYANGSRLVLNSTPAENKEQIFAAIENLRAGGGTNGSGGIQLAYQIAAQNRIDEGVNRVILATDGDFNVGISDFGGLMNLIERKRREGTTLTTLGFGSGNYQEKNLEQLANRGNGNYFYLDSFSEAQRVFGEALSATMQLVAKDVKVQVEFNPDAVLEYRLIGYDNRKLRNQDFNNDAIDAGDIGSGHTVTAFYEVVLADSPLAQGLRDELRYSANQDREQAVAHQDELAFVKLRYKEPQGTQSKLESFEISKSRVLDQFSQASSDFRFATAVTAFASILRQSQYANEISLNDVTKMLTEVEGSEKRSEFKRLLSTAEALRP